MGRSTFEGPILAGDNRFGPLRDVGYARLSQNAIVDFSNTVPNTASYAGSSGQFVASNAVLNTNGVVYAAAGGSVYPSTVVVPTADSATALYRGAVFYLPLNSQIESIVVDYITALTVANTTLTSVSMLVSNGFVTSAPTYGTVTLGTTTVGTPGRITTTYSAANLGNMLSTTSDIATGTSPSQLSQVVVTLAITGTGLGAITAGKFNIDINYVQDDNNIGTSSAYPYGNFD